MKLDFVLDKYDKLDGLTADERVLLTAMDFSYSDYYLGDLILESNMANLSTQDMHMPIVDLALAFKYIISNARPRSHETFEFTESGDTIRFTFDSNNNVEIVSSYSPGVIEISLTSLRQMTIDLASKVYMEITTRYPELKQNETIQKLIE